LLPTIPEKGRRKIYCNAKDNLMNLIINLSDAKRFNKDQIIRLKDLINIKIEDIDLKKNIINSSYHSKELNREFPIIHWLPKEGNIKVSIVKPDGSISNGFGELNLLNIPMNKTIQFERFGFVNPIELEDNCLFCYFTH
ncbi:MAG: hypothetical protein ACW98X_08685, partial [Promethearchaeota archaeon]